MESALSSPPLTADQYQRYREMYTHASHHVLAAMTFLAQGFQQPQALCAADGTLLEVRHVWTDTDAEQCYAEYQALLDTISARCLAEARSPYAT